MSRVICDLPNASLEISGVRFQKLEDGRFISDEIGDEATNLFLSIPGYVLDEDEQEEQTDPVKTTAPARTKAQLAADKKLAAKSATTKPETTAPVVVEPVIPAVVETTDAAPVVVDAEKTDGDLAPVVVDQVEPGAGEADPVNQENEKPADVF